MIYADIIIDISSDKLDRSFQYRVPERLEKKIKAGMVAAIPFGNAGRVRKGYVIGLSDKPKIAPEKIKEISEICSGEETTESRLIALAAWMRENYGSTMIQALRTVLPIQEKIKAKEKKYICLDISEEAGTQLLKELEQTRFKARTRLLRELLEKKRLDYTHAAKELGTTSAVVKKFQEQGIIRIEYDEIMRTSLNTGDISGERRMPLTDEQEAAVKQIQREWKNPSPKPVLIEGVTGSGKTQVYIKLIEQTLSQGKEAIVLIPEIALTYQTVMRFYRTFGERVSIMNSRLSPGERFDQFERAKNGDVDIMIGPRSALFTPFSKLGLIIIDEEHESSYKSETLPRYHARETAIERARMCGASVVLGSATPSVESYYKAKTGEYELLELKHRVAEKPLPKVEVVDLREELKAGNRSILSVRLQELMEDRLKKGQQMMLFINRRGVAGFVSCRACGHVLKCPHCDVSLSQHGSGAATRLVCHYCGYTTIQPGLCPVCGSKYISGFKAGTQKIEQVVKARFPQARVLRMDMDTTRTKDGDEQILSAFSNHEADILIGTQMIVKGHDFPGVTLVGVLAADLSLYISDYRASERTFQLLTQAAGRAGRGDIPGNVIIQTYDPDHYSITTAKEQNYEAFYGQEIEYRKMMRYPPVWNMLYILCASKNEAAASEAAVALMGKIDQIVRENSEKIFSIGPSDAPVAKISDVYRKVIYVKTREHQTLVILKDGLVGICRNTFKCVIFTK